MLDKVHPDLKKHFKDEFQQSLILGIQFFESPDNRDSNFDKANELVLKWSRWYDSDETRAEFKIPR